MKAFPFLNDKNIIKQEQILDSSFLCSGKKQTQRNSHPDRCFLKNALNKYLKMDGYFLLEFRNTLSIRKSNQQTVIKSFIVANSSEPFLCRQPEKNQVYRPPIYQPHASSKYNKTRSTGILRVGQLYLPVIK